jgi:hypothetical protein
MNRNMFALGHVLLASAFGASALMMTACAGKVVPEGSSSALEVVPVSEIALPVVACPGGSAHPNVCCESGPGKAASCGVYPEAPFQACDPTATTYPDPRSCCPIDGSTECVAPPPASPPSSPGCGYACPAGQYQPEGSPAGTCCFTDGDTTACSGVVGVGVGTSMSADAGFGATVDSGVTVGGDTGIGVDASCGISTCACPACAEGEACAPCACPLEPSCAPLPAPTPVCSCPACLKGESCPPCDCNVSPPKTPTPTCGVCPLGWQVPAGEPYLCCEEGPGGVIECFSQGVPPSLPEPQPLPAQPIGVSGGSQTADGGQATLP